MLCTVLLVLDKLQPAPAVVHPSLMCLFDGVCDSQAPNFNSLSGVSLAAAFMSLAYSTIAFAGSINVGKQPGMPRTL